MAATETAEEQISFHPLLRFFARVVSYVFHPLFVPLYIGWFFVYVANIFPQLSGFEKVKLLISFAVNYTILPLATIMLAKGLGFIQSVYLKTQRDRIIPYVATGVFYFWIWYVFKNQDYPAAVVMFSLAVFLASSLGLIVNTYMKVSMHAISAGVVLTLFLILGFEARENFGFYISMALLATGLVCTARLMNSDHHPIEVYTGLLVGIVTQLIAYWLVA